MLTVGPGCARPVDLLTEATGGDLSRSLLWRELLCRHDVTDIASAVHRDQYGCWGFLDLWRTGGQFTSQDKTFLIDIATPITTALRQAQARTFAAPPEQAPSGPVVLLLSANLDVLAQTAETEQYLRMLVPPDGGRSPVPASAYNVAAQLLAIEAGIDANPPQARVHLTAGRWLTLRAARIADTTVVGPTGDIAVTIEHTVPTERATLFAAAHGLSRRETELLRLLMIGSDTRDLASRMFVSDNTVNDHLKSMFNKTGARTRHSMLTRALGT